MSVLTDTHLLLKSFGYGVFQARIVAPVRLPDGGAGALEDRIRSSGILNIQEVVPDPEDPGTAYVLVGEGQPPCEIERRQWEPADLDRLATAARASARLAARVAMLLVERPL